MKQEVTGRQLNLKKAGRLDRGENTDETGTSRNSDNQGR